jgi:ADP-ribose pyrophosphatase
VSRPPERRGPADSAPPPANPPPFAPFPVLRTERIYHSRWCGLRRDWIELRDGREQEYHVVEIPDAVAVVPVLPDGRIVLIGQYRHPHGKTHWEVPAGRMLDGEPAELCAERELLEETGHRAGRWERLPGFYPINGISDHYAHAFAALDCVRVGDATPEDCEQIVVRAFERGEVEALLDAGRVEDVFAAVSLMYWLRRSR